MFTANKSTYCYDIKSSVYMDILPTTINGLSKQRSVLMEQKLKLSEIYCGFLGCVKWYSKVDKIIGMKLIRNICCYLKKDVP